MSHGHGHGIVEGDNKKIAILISVLALFLAIAETLGKSAQTDGLGYKVEASNLWAFFQAKTIRKTTMETAAEQMEVDVELAKDPAVKELLEKRVKEWKTRAARYESEPKPNNQGEGRKELMARARRPGRRATSRWPSITTSSSAPPPSRSPSCSRRPTSSPGWSICSGAPAAWAARHLLHGARHGGAPCAVIPGSALNAARPSTTRLCRSDILSRPSLLGVLPLADEPRERGRHGGRGGKTVATP